MKTIDIVGLTDKKTIECAVQVLGDPRLSDPMVSENVPTLERLAVVSPNGEWLALDRKAQFLDRDVITITRADEGAEELVVPLDFDWKHSRIRDIANDGMLLFQVELQRHEYGNSRRPLLFKPGNKEPLILPPPYDKEARWSFRSLRDDDQPTSHTPYCYTPDGKIFGWAHRRHNPDERVNTRQFEIQCSFTGEYP